ncbi:hypothetical protein D9756_007338 [Leucocoprinus leucothites]|uniref:Uncharacterized protein n=1 Tax=Leucocoprinus leucothites TaxID=201217 RepID=A0A8H5D5S2_9AGAR|nr:hypothetical protein D9756_007338 [Leucoagaricus leucothites]
MATSTVLDVAGDASSAPSPQPSSFIYLALYDSLGDEDVELTTLDQWLSHQLSWRLIPSQSPTIPADGHEIFGIHHDEDAIVSSDNEYDEDPTVDIRAFIRLPIKPAKSYESLVNQVQKCSETFLSEAIEDGWQEWEWVYNMFEHLEVLEYVDDRVTNTWQYKNKSKMEIFKERVLSLAKQVHDIGGPPENRVIDFPLGS